MKFKITVARDGSFSLWPVENPPVKLTRDEAAQIDRFNHGPLRSGVHRNNSCRIEVGPISKITLRGRWYRVSGKGKVWKTRPDDFRVPLAGGEWRGRGAELTPNTLYHFHTNADCGLTWLLENVGYDRKRIVQAIKQALDAQVGQPWQTNEKTPGGLPIGVHELNVEGAGLTDVEREVPEILSGEQGPATLDDTFLAPGREEFDAQSRFVEVYNSRGEHGAGPTEDFYDQHADINSGEVMRVDVASELGTGVIGTVRRIIVEKARHVQSTSDPFLRAECLAEIGRILDSGYVMDFDALRKHTFKELWAEGIVTHSASSRLDFTSDVLFHLEQQAQNNYGADKPPFKVAHLSFTRRDVPFKVSLCGAEWNSDAPLPYINAERFGRFGAPPFTPVCLTCCDALAQMKAHEIGAKQQEAQEQAQDCNCEQMRKIIRMSTFDPPEKRGPGDPEPAWICPAHGKMTVEVVTHDEAMSNLARKLWFYDVAKSCSSALEDEDADVWASAMATAETLMLNAARDPNSDFNIEYDDLINVVTVEERKSGRMAALDPAQADAWTSAIVRDDLREQAETRKRVLLALCFDKFLHNPDNPDVV